MKLSSLYSFPLAVHLLLCIVLFNHITNGQPSTCTGTTYLNVTRSKQYLTTPDYGISNYPPNMDCYFVLKADVDDRILVELIDVDMEAQLFRSCVDFIGFHEGTQAHFTRPYLTFCGRLRDRQVTSKADSLTIQFFSDEVVEGRGVRISYEAVSFGKCEPDWIGREDGTCYRHLETHPKVGWADAQMHAPGYIGVVFVHECGCNAIAVNWAAVMKKGEESVENAQEQCGQMQANLATIRNQEDYDYMSRSFGHSLIHSWIGYTDADQEGTLTSIDSKSTAIFPNPTLQSNDDIKDCLYLDYSYSDQEAYQIADCRSKLTFICQKRNNWSTVLAGSQHQRVRKGSTVVAADYTIWLLILVALILIAIILCILCQACFKQRDRNRVHTAESSRLVRGLDGQIAQPVTTAAKVHQTSAVDYHGGPEQVANQTVAQAASVQTIVHENQAEVSSAPPKLVNEADLRRTDIRYQVDEDQLHPPDVRISSEQAARALPPLSIRETTLQSMNREESFLRSKRTNELFDRPKMDVLKNVSAISLDEFWSNAKD